MATASAIIRTYRKVTTPSSHADVTAIASELVKLGARALTARGGHQRLYCADLRGPGLTFGDSSFGEIRGAAGFPRMLQLSVQVAW